jgi:nickel/cobalt transporter (NiCoT) family protein
VHSYSLGTAGTFGVGPGVTAYLLGARHAFDESVYLQPDD